MAVNEPVRLVVDWLRCDGHGVCAEIVPELVARDEWGYPVVADPDVPDALRGLAARARAACPALALRLEPTSNLSKPTVR